jgi:dephospho-CoA kinase
MIAAMTLIAVTGTNGSGKGTVVDFLVNKKGFKHYSGRSFLTQLLIERGMTVDRTGMRAIANELRSIHEPAFLAKELYAQAMREGSGAAVIESIRNVGEAEFLKSKGAVLIAVDADQHIRYERVQARRSATDQVDFPTFVEHEEREMRPVGPHDMDVRGVMARADATIINNGSIEELHAQIESVLTQLSVAELPRHNFKLTAENY